MWKPGVSLLHIHQTQSILGAEARALISVRINTAAVSQPKNDSQHGSVPGQKQHFSLKCMKEISECFMSHYHMSVLQGWIQNAGAGAPPPEHKVSRFSTANQEVSAGLPRWQSSSSSFYRCSRHRLMGYMCVYMFVYVCFLNRGTYRTVNASLILFIYIATKNIFKSLLNSKSFHNSIYLHLKHNRFSQIRLLSWSQAFHYTFKTFPDHNDQLHLFTAAW